MLDLEINQHIQSYILQTIVQNMTIKDILVIATVIVGSEKALTFTQKWKRICEDTFFQYN